MMRCTQCGRMRPMPQIRMRPAGTTVKGPSGIKEYNAVCSKCLLQVASKPEKQEEQAAVVTEEYPF